MFLSARRPRKGCLSGFSACSCLCLPLRKLAYRKRDRRGPPIVGPTRLPVSALSFLVCQRELEAKPPLPPTANASRKFAFSAVEEGRESGLARRLAVWPSPLLGSFAALRRPSWLPLPESAPAACSSRLSTVSQLLHRAGFDRWPPYLAAPGRRVSATLLGRGPAPRLPPMTES